MAPSTSPTLPPAGTLRHLEPRPGGYWTITGHSSNSLSLEYVMNEGSDSVYYTMQSCVTEEDIHTHCDDFLYIYSDKNAMSNFFSASSDVELASLGLGQPPRDGNMASFSPSVDGFMGLSLNSMLQQRTVPVYNATMDQASQKRCECSHYDSQKSLFEMGQTSMAHSQQQMDVMNDVNWPMSASFMQEMSPMTAVLPNGGQPVLSGAEANGILAELWNESYVPLPSTSAGNTIYGTWATPYAGS